MKRREFIVLVGGAVVAWPQAVRAQQRAKVPRIGYLHTPRLESREGQALREAFWQGMRALGWVEGQNIFVEYRSAEGNLDRFPELAAELARLEVDLIVAGPAAAARAARAQTTTIPIVCSTLGDPVGEGLIASLARPGGNLTGFATLSQELVPKCLSLLKEAVPKASRIAGLLRPGTDSERVSTDMVQQAEAAARRRGIQFILVRARAADDLDSAYAEMQTERADGLLVLPGPQSFYDRQRIAARALRHRLPSMALFKEFAEVGGFMGYGASIPDNSRRAATYVDKILKGAKPADLPVQLPTKFELAINTRTAKALGLTIPPTLVTLADEVIE